MKLNLNAANQQNNLLRLATNVTEAQEAAKTNNTQKAQQTVTNPQNNKLERTPEADTCSFGKNMQEMTKDYIKKGSLVYAVGFCLGACPSLFMIAAAAFLFSNQGQTFMDKIANAIANNADACNKFNQQRMENENKQPQEKAIEAKTTESKPVENNTVTNPIKQAKQPKVEKEQQPKMTPMQKAQADVAKAEQRVAERQERLAQAQENFDKQRADVERAAQRVADCNREKAPVKYEKAMNSLDFQKQQMPSANQRLTKAQVAYEKAVVDLQGAQRILEDLQAEEIVNID